MGLFDAIEQLTASPSPSMRLSEGGNQLTGKSAQHIEQDRPKKKAARRIKPERLFFLQPCPICQGRAFIHGNAGGFFCADCQPGITGQPVEAAGPDRPTPLPNHDLLMANDAGPINNQPAPAGMITEQQQAAFTVAWPWIKENKEKLLSSGWSRAALVARSRFRWPYGKWGLAWLPIWSREGLVVSMGERGAVHFKFHSSGKIITQTASPYNAR